MKNDITLDFRKFAMSKGVKPTVFDDVAKSPTSLIHAPYILEERQMNVQALDIFSRLLYERVVFFNSEVDTDVCNIAIAQLLYLDSLEKRDISLYIDSPGGSCYAGLGLISTMDLINSDVSTIGLGMAASMGAVILSNGTVGKRYVLPYTRVMIHQPSSAMQGTFTDAKIHFEEMESVRNDLYTILAKNCKKSFDEIVEACEKGDKWLKANEVINFGLVDNILSSTK